LAIPIKIRSLPAAQRLILKPLTIVNPYKSEDIKTKDGVYTVEYYVTSVKQSDGVITDDELVPLVFREGVFSR